MERPSVSPNCFGPPLWAFLHMIPVSYTDNPTDNVKKNMYQFFESLQEVLPCSECREHYKQNFNILKNDLVHSLNSRESFMLWVYNLHNQVKFSINPQYKNLNDTLINPTFEQVKEKYLRLSSKPNTCSNTCHSDMKCKVELVPLVEEFTNETKQKIFIFIIIILLIIIIYLFFSQKQLKRKI